MDHRRKTLALTGAGLAAALGIGLTSAQLASADDANSTPRPSATAAPNDGTTSPGGADRHGRLGRPPMDEGGRLTADAASRTVAAALAEVDGGTVVGVRALSDGTYGVMVRRDDTRVLVRLDADFQVTDTLEGGPGGPGRPGGARGPHGPFGFLGDHRPGAGPTDRPGAVGSSGSGDLPDTGTSAEPSSAI